MINFVLHLLVGQINYKNGGKTTKAFHKRMHHVPSPYETLLICFQPDASRSIYWNKCHHILYGWPVSPKWRISNWLQPLNSYFSLCPDIRLFASELLRRPIRRKVLLTSSFIAMTLALAGFAVFFYLKDMQNDTIKSYPWIGVVPLISLIIYSLAYSWGIGNVIWVMMPEILPPQIKGTFIQHWLIVFLSVYCFILTFALLCRTSVSNRQHCQLE